MVGLSKNDIKFETYNNEWPPPGIKDAAERLTEIMASMPGLEYSYIENGEETMALYSIKEDALLNAHERGFPLP